MNTVLKALPSSFRKLVVNKLTPAFREAVITVTEPLVAPDFNQVLVRNKFVGINASDINMSAGRYNRTLKPPFGLGFEGVGEVVGLGESVTEFKLGQPVMYMSTKAFSEYVYLPESETIPIVSAQPEFIPLLVSGTTSSLSLDKAGRIAPGEKVLITAAAGGAGHIAVQWAKNIGCHVIGLCSSDEKVKMLETIGCDRPINYKQENLEAVLKSEYPAGIDVIWETVGGKLFDLLVKNLAIKGRLIVIGATAGYQQQNFASGSQTQDLPIKLLLHSSTLSGFYLFHYTTDIPHYLSLLVRLKHERKLKLIIDNGNSTPEGPFCGLKDIPRAVEYLHSGKSKGKVVVSMSD